MPVVGYTDDLAGAAGAACGGFSPDDLGAGS
ncbi:MAG: hypothetical protein LBJ47_02165 [Tannerella sp.]|nr:hypothetical protein [Tannerella sp.]